MNYWIEKTLVTGRKDRLEGERALGLALWSPQKDKRGGDIYKNMRKVRKGDVVIHLIDNSIISGVSKVKADAVETDGVLGTVWNGPAYLIELEDFTKLEPVIPRGLILNEKNKKLLNEISISSEVFYNWGLNLRQGAYLTPCTLKLASLINSVYKNISNTDLPHFLVAELPIIDIYESSTSISGLPSIEKNESKMFNSNSFIQSVKDSGLYYSKSLLTRFVASLLTKPFVILTGLSGSGKTKLAQAFAQWICLDESQYCIIPVGADWTNREPLLGYPNALEPNKYVKPESGVLDLIMQAISKPELPHFLILDEMNLSHVERYFADFLSVMESKEAIPLYAEGTVENSVPAKLGLPENLFVIGTVNIDETTNMFSPKVLDRANTIEFRVSQDEIKSYLGNIRNLDMSALTGKGASMAKSFLELANNKSFATTDIETINDTLVDFFGELRKTGAEFGFRSASEILRLVNQLTVLDGTLTTYEKIDISIMQKLLPKLHGSRRKLCPVLETLGSFCVSEDVKVIKDVFENIDFDFNSEDVKYPLSLEKISRMYRGATDNGFASFAEA